MNDSIFMLKEWVLDNPFEFVFILLGVFILVRYFKIILSIVFFIVSLLFDLIKIPFLLVLLWFLNNVNKKIINNAINNFESSINNIGIKKDIDVAACHTYFNQIGAGGIQYLIEVYQEKIINEINNNECDNEQIERYNYLMEIMNRSLYYNTINNS